MTSVPDRPMEASALWQLLLWSSPAFPVGAFSHAHGLEWSVEAGEVCDAASLLAWMEDLLRHGSGWSDAVFLAHAYRATVARDGEALSAIASLSAAFAPSLERQVEQLAQGAAFARALAAAWPAIAEALPRPERLPYAVAFGAAAGAARIALDDALTAYLLAFAGMVVSAAVRLVPLGQSDGLRVLAALEPSIAAIAADAREAGIEETGGVCFRADIASMAHETQYTRLFRT